MIATHKADPDVGARRSVPTGEFLRSAVAALVCLGCAAASAAESAPTPATHTVAEVVIRWNDMRQEIHGFDAE